MHTHTKHSAADLPIHIHRSINGTVRDWSTCWCLWMIIHIHRLTISDIRTYTVYILIVHTYPMIFTLNCKYISCVCVDLQIYICIGIYLSIFHKWHLHYCKHILTSVLDQSVYIKGKKDRNIWKKKQASFASFRWRCSLKQTHWYDIWVHF